MGEIRTYVDREVYVRVLEKEISVLKSRYEPSAEGTGHYNTAIGVLEQRVNEISQEINWPFPSPEM
jgi:hypothetical protein